MLRIVRMWHAVALNYSLNRHTEYAQLILYEKSTIRLASMGLTQAHHNNC